MSISIFIALYALFIYLGFEVWPLVLLLVPSGVLLLLSHRYLHLALVLLAGLLFLLLSDRVLDIQGFSSGFDRDRIVSLVGRAEEDGRVGKFYREAVTVSAMEVNVKGGDVAIARGKVRVLYPDFVHVVSGDTVRFYGHFGEFCFNADGVEVLKRSSLYPFRRSCMEFLEGRFSQDKRVNELQSLLLLGLSIDPESHISSLARESGTSYILALSGMHISLISLMLSLIIRPIVGRRGGRVVSLSLLLIYVMLVGPKPSLLRALILSLVLFLLPLESGAEALGVSLLLQLLLFPESLLSLSAAYSYISLGGIMGLGPLLENRLKRIVILPEYLVSSLSASVSALVYTVPFTFHIFGHYTLSSILTGPLAVLVVYVFMILSILSLFLPLPSSFLIWCYRLLEWILERGRSVGMRESLDSYVHLLLFILCLLLVSTILSHIEDVRRCGISTMTALKR